MGDSLLQKSGSVHRQRLQSFESHLNSEVIDLDRLRSDCWGGVPEEKSLRPLCWRLLLNYLPTRRDEWDAFLTTQRKFYEEMIEEVIVKPEQKGPVPSTFADMGGNGDGPSSDHLRQKIYQDQYYQSLPEGKEAHWEVVERILFLYYKLNPGVKYVQGMNEILGPIYYVFASDYDKTRRRYAEHDAFFCFQNLMSEIKDNFIKSLDSSSCGIEFIMTKFHDLLKEVEPKMFEHMTQKLELVPQYYAFRWISLLLSQEFLLPDVIRIWDSLFADKQRFDFLLFVCIAMLTNFRDEILQNDFVANMKLLQNYPPSADVGQILRIAESLKLKYSCKK